MGTGQNNSKQGGVLGPLLAITGVCLLVTLAVWITAERPFSRHNYLGSDVSGSAFSLFTKYYPANSRFRQELEQLREQGRLKPDDEVLIQRSILASSQSLKMPASILWCLLFQESRLNHLEGIEENKAASGIGQFSYYSFYELNNHLDRFSPDNSAMLVKLLGRDVRPVEPRRSDIYHPSSYYFIPTAVSASAAYLNNRYHHLRGLLEKQDIPYSPELLWFYAAMAYNKGTRSVLSFWNDTRRKSGKRGLEKIVLESSVLFSRMDDLGVLTQSLRNIWPGPEAAHFARELRIHMENFKECTVASGEEMGGTR